MIRHGEQLRGAVRLSRAVFQIQDPRVSFAGQIEQGMCAVMYMVGKMGLPQLRQVQRELGDVGMVMHPKAWQTPTCPYACDNNVYAAFKKSIDEKRGEAERTYYRSFWWQEEGDPNWRKMLTKLPCEQPPLWILLPDRVTDWRRTVEMAHVYGPMVRVRELPVALALQDGCDFDEALDMEPDWVFVAGSDEWKEANIGAVARFFKPRGIGVHVGRINTQRRIWLCDAAGVDSCDGTTLNKYRDSTLPLVRDALGQGCLRI